MVTQGRTHQRAWLAIALCLAVLGSTLDMTPAAAEPDDVLVPTMVVLDASGSMRATDGSSGGVTRMDAAKRAATALVKALPDKAPLGLTVYGARTGNKKKDKPAGCKDIEVKAPVAANQKPALTAAIAGVQASGYTPIGQALRVASGALPTAGPRAIVLVSDGIDSCAPPSPCEVAKELKTKGVDLAIHTIGFRVDPAARAELACIAKATGGTYSDARDEDELRDQLVVKATRTLQGYTVSGTPVVGGTSTGSAVLLTPGRYLDSLDASLGQDARVKHYRVQVPAGGRLHASATLVPPPGNRGMFSGPSVSHLNLALTGKDGAYRSEISSNSGDSWTGSAPVSAWSSSTPTSGEEDIVVAVEAVGTLPEKPQPLEVTIAIEPGWSGGALPPPATAASDRMGPSPGSTPSKEVLAGRSFSSPTQLAPGTHLVKSVPGQVGYFSVPVAFGQRLRWSITIIDTGEPLRLFDQAKLTVGIFNPVRQGVSHDPAMAGAAIAEVQAFIGTTVGAGMAAVVRPANREVVDTAPGIASAWLGGDQIIEIHDSLFLAADTDRAVEPASYLLTLAVEGTPEPGPDVITTTEPEELPPVTDDHPDATAPGPASPTSGSPTDSQAVDIPTEESAGASGWLPLVLGIGAALLVAALAIWWLLSRRRTR